MPRDGSGVYTKPFPDVESATPIESAVYNGFVADVTIDLNTPRPVLAGGTGATNADDALIELSGEKGGQVVTNYAMHVWMGGSFTSAGSATGGPVDGHAFAGIVYIRDTDNMVLEARDLDDTVSPGTRYVKQKTDGVWSSWVNETGQFVNAAGDTMTGDLTIDKANPGIALRKTASGQNAYIAGMNGSATRWLMALGNTTAEGGSNTGSDFSLHNYTDAGAHIGTALTVNRADGAMTVNGNLQANGNLQSLSSIVANGNITAGSATSGTYYFGNTGTKYFQYDGSNFVLGGGNAFINSNELTLGNSGTTGTLYFGSTHTKYLNYDAANFSFNGAALVINGYNLYANAVVSGATATTGTYYFGTAATKALTYDGSNFVFSGGSVVHTQDYGFQLQVSGAHARYRSLVLGIRDWDFGTRTDGHFYIRDNTGAVDTLQIQYGTGHVNMTSGAVLTLSTVNATNVIYTHPNNGYQFGSPGYVGGPSPYTVTCMMANPNYSNMYMQALHYSGSFAAWAWFVNGNTVTFRHDGKAYKGDNTSTWDVTSDARIKNVTGDYTSGLDAIAALKPVRFTFKGNNTLAPPSPYRDGAADEEKKAEPREAVGAPYANSPQLNAAKEQKEFIGLLAQDAEKVLPELVKKSSGYIDGQKVEDLREMNVEPIIFALINAVKELKARVEQLEAVA